MGVILVLATSILYPVLLYKLFRFIECKSRLRMYWIIMPLSVLISLSIPFNEPSIRWEQLGAEEVAGAGMWIYSDDQNAENRYIGLNEQETDQIIIMLSSIPGSAIMESQYAERTLAAEIWLSFKKKRSAIDPDPI